MTPAGRIQAAIDLLAAIEAAPRRPADAIASDYFRAHRFIGGGDRRAISELAWGAIRQRLRLDWHLAGTGAPATPRLILAAQLLIAEGWTPQRLAGHFTGDRFAPAALDPGETEAIRRLAGRPLAPPEMPEGPRLNIPAWALPGLAERFGDRLPEEAAAMEGTAPLDLRANLLRATRDSARLALAAEAIPAEPTALSPWGLRLPDRRPIAATAAFREGLVEVQDEGSQLIALLADARPGMRVADYCAGAAGKTLAMAATMGNRGHIVACDVSAVRLDGAARRLRRAGVNNAERHLLEPGDKWRKRRGRSFDRVLVDAPCTGTGTWRRNPDARLRTRAEDLAELAAKQSVILDEASELVRPGGRLIYATCSLLPEEDEMQLGRFLARHADFVVRPFAALWTELAPGVAPPCEGPHMVLSPARHGTDGFFAAVLERRP
jgi:16S rRNA (cytosine967-C5)-methyltransferase